VGAGAHRGRVGGGSTVTPVLAVDDIAGVRHIFFDRPERFISVLESFRKPLDALVTTKRPIEQARLPAASAARRREELEFAWLARGPDHAEALAAFRERRTPRFTDRSAPA
jgi:enoyl-CoA hydratase/carnithine racemase